MSPPPPVSRAGRLGKPDRASQQATRAMATSTRLKRAATAISADDHRAEDAATSASPEQRERVPWPRRSATPREDPGGLRFSAGGGEGMAVDRSGGRRALGHAQQIAGPASPKTTKPLRPDGFTRTRTRPAPPKLPTK